MPSTHIILEHSDHCMLRIAINIVLVTYRALFFECVCVLSDVAHVLCQEKACPYIVPINCSLVRKRVESPLHDFIIIKYTDTNY